jgi:hypothetical protein
MSKFKLGKDLRGMGCLKMKCHQRWIRFLYFQKCETFGFVSENFELKSVFNIYGIQPTKKW